MEELIISHVGSGFAVKYFQVHTRDHSPIDLVTDRDILDACSGGHCSYGRVFRRRVFADVEVYDYE